MGRRVLKFDGAFDPEGCDGGFAADYKKAGPRPLVISTEAGQPPIGKPLIVQARGQLRLTWRLYAESPQSGEISPLSWYGRHYGRRSSGSEYHQSGLHLPLAVAGVAAVSRFYHIKRAAMK